MALTHLADTSVLTRLRDERVRARLEPLLLAGTIGRPTIADLEIGFSAHNGEHWDQLQNSLGVFATIDVETSHLERALSVQRLLADRGLRGRKVPDLVIAACAEEHRLTVLHYDADFDHIAAVTGQRCEWAAPAGSID